VHLTRCFSAADELLDRHYFALLCYTWLLNWSVATSQPA